MSEFVRVNNLVLHCHYKPGVGVPVVFINSLGSSFGIWDDVIADFARPILRYDKRGHGLSDAPTGPYSIEEHANDLAALLQNFDLQKVFVVGISVGGQIALDFVARFPALVAGAVFCDTGMKIGTPEFWETRIQAVRQHGLTHISDAVMQRWLSEDYSSKNPSALRGYQNMLERTPMAGYVATCEALRDSDLTVAAKSIKYANTKTLVLCGELDQSTPLALSQALAETLGTHLHIVENAGHLPCIEVPNVVAGILENFFEEANA